MTDDPQVVVSGHLCLDVTPAFINKQAIPLTGLFVPGRLINMGEVSISTGGSVSNTGIALQKLGISAGLMGKIGHDLFGDCIIRLLKESRSPEGLPRKNLRERGGTSIRMACWKISIWTCWHGNVIKC